MNRQIKFRGKVVKHDPMTNPDNGWVEGFYCQDLSNGEIKHYIHNCPMTWEVDPTTIGQFTGLTDCNGTEIYEGDIVRIDCHPWLDWKELESVNAKVLFEDFAFIAQWKNPDAGKSYGFPDDDGVESEYVTDILSNLPNTIEVIGNIHNNPIEE